MRVVIPTCQPWPSDAEDVLGGHPDVLEEHLVELGVPGDLAERADGDARRVHVDEEVGEPLVLRDARVGAGEQHHPVGDLREAGPDLLAVDDVVVAVPHGPGLERREVRARVGLGVALAPDLLAGEDLLEVALLLGVGPVGDDRRAGHAEAEDVERRRRPVKDQLLVEEELLHPREPAAPELLGPREAQEPGLVKLPLPVPAELVQLGPRHVAHDRARRPVRRQVGREPGSHLGAKGLLLGGEPEVHRSSAASNRAHASI